MNQYHYMPFGEMTNLVEAVEQPFKFMGSLGVLHDSGAIYYVRARYYDSETGSFLSEDPEDVFLDQLNLYQYSAYDPMNFLDHDGRNPLVLVFGGLILTKAYLNYQHQKEVQQLDLQRTKRQLEQRRLDQARRSQSAWDRAEEETLDDENSFVDEIQETNDQFSGENCNVFQRGVGLCE